MNYCYLMFDDAGTLLYVGITSDVEKRMQHHTRHRPWIWQVASIVFDYVGDRQLALDVETNYINVLNPMWNVRKASSNVGLHADLWRCPFDTQLLKLDRRFHASQRLCHRISGTDSMQPMHVEIEKRMTARIIQARERRKTWSERTGSYPYVLFDPMPRQELNWPMVPPT